MECKEYQRNQVIFRENDNQDWMYSICEGAVDIYTGYGTSNEKKISTLTKGQFFGEIGMIAVMPRTATAIAAAEHVVLEQIGYEDLELYLNNHPENLQPIMSNVSGRIRDLTEDLASITMMTNAVMQYAEGGNNTSGWLKEQVSGLLGRLKEKKAQRSEFAMMQKRQKALSEANPPLLRYRAGDVIFREGEAADCMYEIYDGSVGIYMEYQTENEKLLRQLATEEVFGEMGILDDMPRSATAVCMMDCTLLLVKPEYFMQYFQNRPAKVLQILQQMCMQLRSLTNTYLQVCKTLEELPATEEENFHEDEVLAKLEYMRQTQLCVGMYDIYGTCGWMYDRL